MFSIIPLIAQLLCTTPQFDWPTTPELTPVWTLTKTADQAPIVVTNQLHASGTDRAFPVRTILLHDIRQPPPQPGVTRIGGLFSYVAIVPVSGRGEVAPSLQYLPDASLWRGPWGSEPYIPINHQFSQDLAPYLSRFDPWKLAGTAPDSTWVWQPSPVEGIGVLLTHDSLQLLRGDKNRVALTIPCLIGSRTAFAADARRCAAVIFTRPESTRPSLIPGDHFNCKVIVFDFDGHIIRTVVLPPDVAYNSPYLSNDGTFVVLTEPMRGSIDNDRVVILDVASGTLHQVEGLTGGYRYYSRNGRFFANLQCFNPSKIQLYEMAGANAVRRAEYVAEQFGVIFNIAINGDGSLLAAMVTKRNISDTVVVLDRSMRAIGTTDGKAGIGQALMFAGDFLFVGYQSFPETPLMNLQPTDRIDLYDVKGLR